MDLSTLRDYARSKSDEQSTGFVSNVELNRFINQGSKYLYNTIAQRFENYFIVRGDNGSSFTTFATTDVNTTTDQITISRSLQTGDPIVFKTTGILPAGLSASITYYVIRVSSTVIQVASTIDNAESNTAIDITSQGSGTHSIGNRGRFDTVNRRQEYPLPSDMMKLVRVEHRQSGSVSEDDWLGLNSLNIGNDRIRTFYPPREGWGPGPGFGYFIAGNKIYLRPEPTFSFQIRLWYLPRMQDLSQDSDVPIIPEEYHELIADYAAIEILAKSGENIWRERSEIFKNNVQNLIETIEIRNQQSEQMMVSDEFSFDITGFSVP